MSTSSRVCLPCIMCGGLGARVLQSCGFLPLQTPVSLGREEGGREGVPGGQGRPLGVGRGRPSLHGWAVLPAEKVLSLLIDGTGIK